MSTYRFPSLFLSHGTPMHAFGEDSYQETLFQFASKMTKPKAIVFLSAHSVSSDQVHVLKTEQNWIQHDFNGFPEELYQIKYNCAGDPLLADQIVALLTQSGFKAVTDLNAPLDHGIWIPLKNLYPKGDVPVVRVSLPLNILPALVLKMGHALAALREQGIMIVASGGAVHNLGDLKWSDKNGEGFPWAKQFEEWLIRVLQEKNVEELLAFEEFPGYFKAHPSNEHFLPILFAVGATLPGDDAQIIFRGIEYGSLSMLCFSLNQSQKQQSLH